MKHRLVCSTSDTDRALLMQFSKALDLTGSQGLGYAIRIAESARRQMQQGKQLVWRDPIGNEEGDTLTQMLIGG